MAIKLMPDGSYQAGRLMVDPATSQEIMVMGFGDTRGECLLDLDRALALQSAQFPGLKAVVPNQIPVHRLLEAEETDREDPNDPPHEPLLGVSKIWQGDGKVSNRVFNWYDRKMRRRFMGAGIKAVENNGGFSFQAASASLEGGV